MIAKWPMGEQFDTTTLQVKRVPFKILAPKRNNLELVSFA
jgi:hypothetical protein